MAYNRNIRFVLGVFLFSFVITDYANAGSTKPVRSPLSFDLTTRKKTKIIISDHLSFAGSITATYLSERNLKLDDQKNDYTNKYKAILEVSGRVEISSNTTAFGHVEFSFKGKDTHKKSYSTVSDIRIKEALIAYKFTNDVTISLGRLRLSDKNRWVADKAIDGIHFGRRTQSSGYEIVIGKDDDRNNSLYTLAHYTRFQKKHTIGVYAIAERTEIATLGHLIGYINNQRNNRFSYTANIAGVLGGATIGGQNGFGFDFRATQKVARHALNPQITYGLAIGSKGFRQTGLQSNKTKDGGKTLCNRYGFVYQPDLTNLAVVSIGFALRPSRAFSIDLNTYAYAQVSKQITKPSARISGSTTGHSSFLGAEVSLIGSWRPMKKMKVEFGAGVFHAGSAYQSKTSSKRLFLRIKHYF